MAVDLHLHTHYSDGSWSPAELVERAVALKLSYIAITDHDTTGGIKEAQEAAAGRLTVIPAIEVNTVGSADDGTLQDIHILGYFMDENSVQLREALARQQQARHDLVVSIIAKLAALGVNISMELVASCAGYGSIGRPHITQALLSAGAAAEASEAYDRYLSRQSPYYVERESISPREAIAAIRAAGGIASIAHPGKQGKLTKTILDLQEAGLQALEAYHKCHSVDTVQSYIRFANRYRLAITGGSDCHGPQAGHPPSIGSISVPDEVVYKLRGLIQEKKMPDHS